MEGDVPAELLTKHVLPDVGVDAFVVVRPWVGDLIWRETVVLCVIFESELERTCEHGPF
jgi:hypothetical protein